MNSITLCEFCSETVKGNHKYSCTKLLDLAQNVDLYDSKATFQYITSPQDQLILDSIKIA